MRQPDTHAAISSKAEVVKAISPEARRALAEAEQRRAAASAGEIGEERPREVHGRGGKEPVRYGDWEVKGLASDF